MQMLTGASVETFPFDASGIDRLAIHQYRIVLVGEEPVMGSIARGGSVDPNGPVA